MDSQSSKITSVVHQQTHVCHVNHSIQFVRIIKLDLDTANALARDLSFTDRFSSRHDLTLSLLPVLLFLSLTLSLFFAFSSKDQVTRYEGGTPLVPKRDPQGADSAVGPHTTAQKGFTVSSLTRDRDLVVIVVVSRSSLLPSSTARSIFLRPRLYSLKNKAGTID